MKLSKPCHADSDTAVTDDAEEEQGTISWSMVPPPDPPLWDIAPAPWHWTMMNDVPRNMAYR